MSRRGSYELKRGEEGGGERGSVLRQQSVIIVRDGGGIFLNFLSLQEL